MASTDFDVVQLGAAEVDPDTGLPVVQAVNPAGDDEEDVEHYGKVDFACALGVTALPAPKDADGAAEGVILRSCGGTDGLCVGGRDDRVTRDIVGELSSGDTCLHATGKGFASRVLCKEQMASIVVGNPADVAITVNRGTEQIQIVGFGHIIEVSREQGIVLAADGDKAFISIKDDTIWIKAPKVLIGDKPIAPALVAGAPVTPVKSILLDPT